jgi:hypothetical protein
MARFRRINRLGGAESRCKCLQGVDPCRWVTAPRTAGIGAYLSFRHSIATGTLKALAVETRSAGQEILDQGREFCRLLHFG